MHRNPERDCFQRISETSEELCQEIYTHRLQHEKKGVQYELKWKREIERTYLRNNAGGKIPQSVNEAERLSNVIC